MTPPASARDATTRFWAAVLFLVGVGVFGLYYNRGLILADEGSLIHATQRIAHGEVPYRDFYHFYAPGSFYVLAALFKVLGERLLVSRMMWVVVRALSVTLAWVAASRLMPRRFAIWPALAVLFIPGPWFKAAYGFSALLSFWALLRYVERPTVARVAGAALAVAAALLLRQDVGAEAAVALVFALALAPFVGECPARPGRQMLIHAGAAFAVLALSLLPVLVYFQRRNALGPMWEQLFGLAPSYTFSKWRAIVRKLPILRQDPAQLVMFCLPPLVLLTTGIRSLVRLTQRTRSREDMSLFLLAALGAMTLLPAYLPMAPIRLYQCAHLAWIATAFLLWRLGEFAARRVPGGRPATVVRWAWWTAVGAIWIALILNVILVKRFGLASTDYAGTLRTHFRNTTPVTLRGERIYLHTRRGRQLNQLVRYIRERTTEGEAILVFPNQALLYFLCDRRNPTRFVGTFTLKYPDEAEDRRFWSEWVEDARHSDARYLIVSRKFVDSGTRHYFQAVISKRFETDHAFGELLVMKRRPKR